MPAGYAVIRSDKVITPLGPIRWQWLERVARSKGQDLLSAGQEFHAWWNRGCDGDFWHKYAMAIAWCDLKYRLPMNPAQRSNMKTVRRALAKAESMDPGCVDANLLAEIDQLLGADPQTTQPPKPEGVGYLRQVVTLPATGLWSVELPGWWHREVTDDGSEVCFWWDDRSVRISSLSVEGEDGQVPDPQTMLSGHPGPSDEPDLEFRHGRRIGWAQVTGSPPGNNGEFQLQGTLAVPGSLAMVTVTFHDPTHRTWALETFEGIRHPLEDQTGSDG
jgi:hypothetical protein